MCMLCPVMPHAGVTRHSRPAPMVMEGTWGDAPGCSNLWGLKARQEPLQRLASGSTHAMSDSPGIDVPVCSWNASCSTLDWQPNDTPPYKVFMGLRAVSQPRSRLMCKKPSSAWPTQDDHSRWSLSLMCPTIDMQMLSISCAVSQVFH